MEGMERGGGVEVGEGRSVRVMCLAQEHYAMSLARTRTQTARSEHEPTNQEGIARSGWSEKAFVPLSHILSTKTLRCLAAFCSRICEIDACCIRWSTSINEIGDRVAWQGGFPSRVVISRLKRDCCSLLKCLQTFIFPPSYQNRGKSQCANGLNSQGTHHIRPEKFPFTLSSISTWLQDIIYW